jgi:Holliday junction DNA helicase RuvB
MVGEGIAAHSVQLELPPFTLIGATTRAGRLTSPLRDRFGIVQRLAFYEVKDLQTIVVRSADILDIQIELDGALEIAKRSRGTPRIANRLLRRVRDFADVKTNGIVHQAMTINFFIIYSVSCEKNLSEIAKMVLLIRVFIVKSTLFCKKNTKNSFFTTKSKNNGFLAIGEDRGTLEDMVEPYLIQQGFIMRTPRGRSATNLAYTHLGLKTPDASASSLFDSQFLVCHENA